MIVFQMYSCYKKGANMGNKLIHSITNILTSIGAINWGLVGAFKINLVSLCFGENTPITQAVYLIVGVCGLSTLVRTIIYTNKLS